MKKIFAVFITVILLSLTACGTTPAPVDESTVLAEKQHYENLCVDIGVNEDGYYGLMADVDIDYDNGEISSIYIDDPVLLAFCVSSAYDKGVYLLKQTEGAAAITSLTEVRDALVAAGNTELADKLTAVIEILNNSGPIVSAST